MGMDDQIFDLQALAKITQPMDVPKHRKNDYMWMRSNLWVKNSEHKDFKRAIELIDTIIDRQRYLVKVG